MRKRDAEVLDIKRMICIALLMTLISCSQEGEVVVENLTGGDLDGTINGSSYYLCDGDAVLKKINIGRRFIFGPGDKDIRVTGSGTCKWTFSETAVVGDDVTWTITLHGDAGYITFCNLSGYYFNIYLSPCSETSWGPRAGVVPPDECATWKVIDTCWDMLVDGPLGRHTEYGIIVEPCDEHTYGWLGSNHISGHYAQQDMKLLAPDMTEHGESNTKIMDNAPFSSVNYKRPRLISR